MTIAKLRAARQLWARVAEVVGEPDAGAATVHAVTSLPMMAQRDPWVNMLRTTLAAFAAGVGGADTVLVHPFDVAIPGGFPGTAASFARRIARNTQLLLLEESHIGRVLDPAGGSWFVEDLTEQLAEQAWKHFQDIESRGGFVEAPSTSSPRRSPRWPSAAPTTSRTGAPRSPVSTSIPNLAEPPLPQGDSVSPVRALRGRVRGAARPLRRVPREDRVAAAGVAAAARSAGRAQHPHHVRRRTCWPPAASRRSTRTVDAAGVAQAVSVPAPEVAVICGTDARYATEASGGRRCRPQGGRVPRSAGRAGEGRRRSGDPKPDGYLTAKIDAVEALSDLLTRLGA